MWFFIDESWPPPNTRPPFGVLFGVLVRHDQLERLEKLLFAVRRKYYGRANAKDLRQELKGQRLLSNHVLRMCGPDKPIPKNLCVVREIISYPLRHPEFYVRLFASTVYSDTKKLPSLLAPDATQLADPFQHLVTSASRAAREDGRNRVVTLVFDQRLGAQRDIAIAIRNFVGGMALPNVHRYPYFAVSNASPGVQLADVFAHLMSKRVQKVKQIMNLYNEMKALQWESQSLPKRFGFLRLNEVTSGRKLAYRRRNKW